jgi:hypothetical protein
MNAAVIRECADRVKLELELRAAVENAGVPHPRRMARCARSGAMETGIPDPFDCVARFDRDVGGRKFIATRPDVNVEALRLRISRADKNDRGNEAEDRRE